MTLDDIRELEERTKRDLDESRAKPPPTTTQTTQKARKTQTTEAPNK